MTTSAPIAVTALGMVSSLGTSVAGSCAAARARLSMPEPVKNLDIAGEGIFGSETQDGQPVIFGHHVRGIADAFSGFARLALLAEAALGEALRASALSPIEAQRTALALCVPSQFVIDEERRDEEPAASIRRAERLLARIATHDAWPAEPARRSFRLGGAAAFALALSDAASQLALGQVDRVVVGAVDSRVDPRSLRALATLGQLKTNDNPAGSMPGEAAAFAVLERGNSGRGPALAKIVSSASSNDGVSLLDPEKSPDGVQLAASLRAAALGGRVDWLIADLTGSSRRAVEWGNAVARARDVVGDAKVWMPAMSFGDVGAAAGAVALCVATRAFARGYAPAFTALVALSSEDGAKGAFSVQATG